MRRIVRSAQFHEWSESPVCEVLREVIQKELDAVYEARAEAFIQGEPIKTQEIRAGIIGEESRLQDILDILSVDNSTGTLDRYFSENNVTIIEEEESYD